MNTVTGRIVVKESGVGVPDLLIVLFDVDPNTRPEEFIAAAEAVGGGRTGTTVLVAGEPLGADRIGSVLTGAEGRFQFTYDDAETRTRNPSEKRPDLLLLVLAPEEPGVQFAARILYHSTGIRQDAGRTESYLVRLSADALRKAQVPIPSAGVFQAEPPTAVRERLRAEEAWHSDLVDASITVARGRLDQHRGRFAPFNAEVAPALRASLSVVPGQFHDTGRFVGPDESVLTKSHALMARNLRDVVNNVEVRRRTPMRGVMMLTDDEATELKAQAGADGHVPEEAVVRVRGRNGTAGDTFVQRTPLSTACRGGRSEAEARCEALIDGRPPGPPPPHVTAPGITAVTVDDVPRFIAQVMGTMTSPEEQLSAGLMPSASRTTVDTNIRELAFPPSPADVPAFHDFHQLQIAFQHVWQEAIDEGVVDLAEDAYQSIVELGGTPQIKTAPGPAALNGLLAEGRAVISATRIVSDHSRDPSSPFSRILDRFGRPQRNNRPDAPYQPTRGPRGQSGASDSIERVTRLPDLLVELQKRLRGSYAFTTYAANRQERSVNFGILNTYRQVWKPLAYQAGPLVKSIPLAPKQTQKLVVTRKVHRKRTLRELENNLRSVREEMSQTSRAEEEIARRASSKTTFSLSNTAGGNMEVASNSTTATFTQDATKSSDDVKKSFREAVFKAAQEVKQERTTEVNTEESEDVETVETTEISNPNDEIAVTFLFYELQRRYRMSERLYRVRPVVLVAQEMPAPHEIDIDWLVTYDWILKRSLLDDSFLPAISWLTKSAGEQSSIAELKVNIDQQRSIVEELREELVVARRGAASQAALLERAVLRKALPEGDGGGGGLGGLVGGLVGGIGGIGGAALDTVGDLIFGGDASQSQNNRQAMEDAAQRAADHARELMFRMEREVTALNALMESYAKAVQEHHYHLTEIARLQVHIKDNILYYMQAIWGYEPPDQRFFRLHTVPVPTFKPVRRQFRIDFAAPVRSLRTPAHQALARFGGRVKQAFRFESDTAIDPTFDVAPLAEVADLDTPLGFKGNYMIFPLRESNALTDFMMDPYVDRATGELLDPSEQAGMTLDEFSEYVCCLKDALSEEEFESVREELRAQHEELLTAPRRGEDVLVVPTDSLFIETLPATETLIEPYKKIHRLEDVKKVQEEVRGMQMENIRKMARMLAGEREDPNIDKRVLIEGDGSRVVVDDT